MFDRVGTYKGRIFVGGKIRYATLVDRLPEVVKLNPNLCEDQVIELVPLSIYDGINQDVTFEYDIYKATYFLGSQYSEDNDVDQDIFTEYIAVEREE